MPIRWSRSTPRPAQRRWHFQIVHHDVWDYDLPAQPILADVQRNGTTVPVVVQLTKMGLVFVFNRLTGAPIFGVEERPVPQSDVPGEATSPTQPFPVKPPPLARIAPLTREDLTTVSDASRRQCEEMFATRQKRRAVHAAGPRPHVVVPRHAGRCDMVGGRGRIRFWAICS